MAKAVEKWKAKAATKAMINNFIDWTSLLFLNSLIIIKITKEIKVIGTACKNELWMKLKSDILGKEILSYEIDEAVSMGVAVLSAYKNNYIDDLSVINNNLNIKKILPNKRISSYYENIYENFYKPFYKLKMDIEKTTG